MVLFFDALLLECVKEQCDHLYNLSLGRNEENQHLHVLVLVHVDGAGLQPEQTRVALLHALLVDDQLENWADGVNYDQVFGLGDVGGELVHYSVKFQLEVLQKKFHVDLLLQNRFVVVQGLHSSDLSNFSKRALDL